MSFFDTRGRSNELLPVAAVVLKSKIYVIHGYQILEIGQRYDRRVKQPAVVHCFHPAKNKWEEKASTCHPHFGSCLFVVNNRLCVAGETFVAVSATVVLGVIHVSRVVRLRL